MFFDKVKGFLKTMKKEKYNQFFEKKLEYGRLEDIVFLTKSEVIGDYDVDKKIYSVATLKKAKENDISFLTNSKYIDDLKNTKAGAVFIEKKMLDKVPEGTVALINENPHFAYMLCLETMYNVPVFNRKGGISRKAHIAWSAKIGKNVEIQDGAYIDKNVVIGDNCKICANAVIYHDCKIGENTFIGANAVISYANIGKNCIIHNGAMIGQDGFGFVHHKMFNFKIPQIGKVVVGDHVEIGANTCIDRGIAGSTEIGNFVQLGGKVGLAGHIKIADGVQIAGNSGIAQSIDKPMSAWGGSPALPVRKWHKLNILLEKMINNKKEEKENE